jgi:hypothetical protein
MQPKKGRLMDSPKRSLASAKGDKTNQHKKQRKIKTKKPSNGKPKRPLSAYNVFFSEERVRWLEEENLREDKDKSDKADVFRTLGKVMGERWKALTPELRERYIKIASEDKERYQRELAEGEAEREPPLEGRSVLVPRKPVESPLAPKSPEYSTTSSPVHSAVHSAVPGVTHSFDEASLSKAVEQRKMLEEQVRLEQMLRATQQGGGGGGPPLLDFLLMQAQEQQGEQGQNMHLQQLLQAQAMAQQRAQQFSDQQSASLSDDASIRQVLHAAALEQQRQASHQHSGQGYGDQLQQLLQAQAMEQQRQSQWSGMQEPLRQQTNLQGLGQGLGQSPSLAPRVAHSQFLSFQQSIQEDPRDSMAALRQMQALEQLRQQQQQEDAALAQMQALEQLRQQQHQEDPRLSTGALAQLQALEQLRQQQQQQSSLEQYLYSAGAQGLNLDQANNLSLLSDQGSRLHDQQASPNPEQLRSAMFQAFLQNRG